MTRLNFGLTASTIIFCVASGPAWCAAYEETAQTDPLTPFHSVASTGCSESSDTPCVRLWSEMNAVERAKLWPYLDDVAKAQHWRSMTRQERRALRQNLCDADREALRRRFSVESLPGESAARRRVKLCKEERRLMREQIMEVHMEISGSGTRRATQAKSAEGEP